MEGEKQQWPAGLTLEIWALRFCFLSFLGEKNSLKQIFFALSMQVGHHTGKYAICLGSQQYQAVRRVPQQHSAR